MLLTASVDPTLVVVCDATNCFIVASILVLVCDAANCFSSSYLSSSL